VIAALLPSNICNTKRQEKGCIAISYLIFYLNITCTVDVVRTAHDLVEKYAGLCAGLESLGVYKSITYWGLNTSTQIREHVLSSSVFHIYFSSLSKPLTKRYSVARRIFFESL
jgi:hypothetical protein